MQAEHCPFCACRNLDVQDAIAVPMNMEDDDLMLNKTRCMACSGVFYTEQ